MFRKLRKYRPFISAGIQETITYRSNFLLYRAGDVLGAFVTFFLWQAVFRSASGSTLNGFTLPQMTLYIFLTFFTGIVTKSEGTMAIGDEVKGGSIAIRLLRPVSFKSTFLFQEMGHKIMEAGMMFIPFFGGLIIYQVLNPAAGAFSLWNILIYLVSAILAYLLNFYFNIVYGFTAFVFKNLWGSSIMKNAIVGFMSGAVIPLSFFPDTVASVLKIFPFASFSYTPVMLYMGKYDTGETIFSLVLQVFWVLFFAGLSEYIWRRVISYLNIQGG